MLKKRNDMNLMPVLILVAFIIPGCSESNEANKENFIKSIQAYLDQDPACLGSSKIGKKSFEEYRDLDELVKLGLLKKENLKPKDHFDYKVAYSLTDAGRKISRVKEGLFGETVYLCYGNKIVVDISSFTPPNNSMDGLTVSHVNYTYKVADIADWAKKLSVISLEEALDSNNHPISEKATLVLTDSGWVDRRLMN